jgi:Flp pilus assembly pilin Flp
MGILWNEHSMLKKVQRHLLAMHRDDRGAMSVEKVLILAIIALPILIALFAFRKTIVTWFNARAEQLNNTD